MKKITLYEYGRTQGIETLSTELGIPKERLIKTVQEMNVVLKSKLSLDNPFKLSDNTIRAQGLAGIISYKGIEIEIVPKFLQPESDDWREDFYFLSNMSKYGDSMGKVSSQVSNNKSLFDLIGNEFIMGYLKNHRNIIRKYNKKKYEDFIIHGTLEAETILMPSEQGFSQTTINLTKKNQYNAVILGAALILKSLVSNITIKVKLQKVIDELSPQDIYKLPIAPLPIRHRKWESVYELSRDILKLKGNKFGSGQNTVLGYTVNTWRTWEKFVSSLVSNSFPNQEVLNQHEYSLGIRKPAIEPVKVKPDSVLLWNTKNGATKIVVDAKYKNTSSRVDLKISEADIYQSLAFATALNSNVIFLIYPHFDSSNDESTRIFERIKIKNVNIVGVGVNVKGISNKNNRVTIYKEFSKNIKILIRALLR
ncbi:5-methylcytosine restriction system specificity protein McrC [Bhargavaea massiliensis]|uniref:5-methylcytosine restriction system specificity protein McrC n=1 Tax=Bhargavaea massiliensis TaxID=2697500 RepID=UPI001BCD6A1F|nr:hypothetical protein [Bhargavaea massiliensis]